MHASASLVAAIVVAMEVLILGVLAAIIIPALQDYNMHIRISEVMCEMGE